MSGESGCGAIAGSVVGIDFGTSTSLVAERDGHRGTEVWPLGDGTAWIASVVAHTEDGFVVGEEADSAPQETIIQSVKRAITEKTQTIRLGSAEAMVEVPADDVIVAVFSEIVRRSQGRVNLADHPRLRLGCPAMWDGGQRHRLLNLAGRAGLRVSLADLIDEPVAAGIAWLSRARARGEVVAGRVLVFDMGGGTLDVAVLDVRGDDVAVLAALGMTQAGDYLDTNICADLTDRLGESGINVESLEHPQRARHRLLLGARAAKLALSDEDEHFVGLPRRQFGIASMPYLRTDLEAAFAPQMDNAEQYVWAALRTARLTERLAGSAYDLLRLPVTELARDVSHVVLAGGMSRIPYVARRLRQLFPHASTIEAATQSPEEAVVLGLAGSAEFGRINMFRPAFDVAIEWGTNERRSLYEAYAPVYQQWQVFQGGSDLCHRQTGLDLGLPRSGPGRLTATSPTGMPVSAILDGRPLDGFPIEVSEQKFDFRIYCDGRIRLTDGNGSFDGHVEGWKMIQGRDHAERLKDTQPLSEPDLAVPYPFNVERN